MLRFRPSSDYINRHLRVKRWFTIFVNLMAVFVFFVLFNSTSMHLLIVFLFVPLTIAHLWTEYSLWKKAMSFVKDQRLEIHNDFLSMVNSYGENKIFFKDITSVSQNLLNIELKLVNGECFIIHDFESPEIILAELSRKIST